MATEMGVLPGPEPVGGFSYAPSSLSRDEAPRRPFPTDSSPQDFQPPQILPAPGGHVESLESSRLPLSNPLPHMAESSEDVTQASLWRNVETPQVSLSHAPEQQAPANHDALPSEGSAPPQPWAESAGSVSSTAVETPFASWRNLAVAAALFCTGMLVCPLIVGIALVRFLRKSRSPLFRVEIVGAGGEATSIAWASSMPLANGQHPVEPQHVTEGDPSAEPVRRGAVSLEPPPLELPAEETFVARRRREQSQQNEYEQQILQQLFEDNIELRRQMEG